MRWISVLVPLELAILAYSHNKECPGVMDLAFMVDVSASIQFDDVNNAKKIMADVTSRFVVSSTESEKAVESSQQLKDEGIVIITLGITSNVNKEQLRAIASSNGKALTLSDENLEGRMELIANEITAVICEVTRKSEAIVHLVKEQSTLQGHLILSIQTNNELLCAMKCLNTANCFSFNYKRYNNVCELNHTNKLTSPNDLTRDLLSVYYEMVFS
ncbi:uncharacterized protein [Montipora foliosa]|uniref:uncharacterized protein isoform X3 n=1 Tax=Montipora foliosa TaxID=591990 RepID=UPI0035F1AC3C